MKRAFLSLFLVFGVFSASFAANNATDVYLLAKTESISELKKVENIDIVDSDGNTALCSAIKYDDVDAYNILKKAGANTEHKCTKKIPGEQYKTFIQKVGAANKSWSFLGLGKWAWTAIGAGVVAGGAAAAMGGGGGGGSSGGSSSSGENSGSESGGGNGNNSGTGNQPEDPNLPCSGYNYTYASQCPAGYTLGSSCTSGTIVKYKCDQATTCPYDTTECTNGYIETGSICVSGETVYKQCMPASCTGYEYTDSSQCPAGYTLGSSCQSGEVTKYKCDTSIACEGYNYTDSSQCPAGYVTGSSCLSGTTMKYKCDAPATCSYQTTSCTTGFHETGATCQSGETTYVQCEPDACEGFNYTSCPQGWDPGESCQSGNVTKYKCDVQHQCIGNNYYAGSCPAGWISNGSTCRSGNTLYVSCRRSDCSTGTNAVFLSCDDGWYQVANTTHHSCTQYGVTYNIRCEAYNCSSDYMYTNSSQCPSGWELGSSCKSGDNPRKYKCDQPKTCPYTTTSCTGGYQETGNTCRSGNTLYKECEQIQCGANATWSESGCVCNEGYQNWTQGSGCSLTPIDCGSNAYQQGTQCQCNEGYTSWTEGIGCYQVQDCGVNATQVGNTCVCNYGYQEWTSGYGCYEILDCGSNAYQQGDQCRCDEGYVNWIEGIGCIEVSDCGLHARKIGTQCVCEPGYVNWTENIGCTARGSSIPNGQSTIINNNSNNAVSGKTDCSNHAGIYITKNGNGNVYGLVSGNGLWGMSQKTPTVYEEKSFSIQDFGAFLYPALQSQPEDYYYNMIFIDKNGNGNVYGLYSTNSNASIVTNAFDGIGNLIVSNSGASVGADIIINNDGNGNIYGLYSNKTAYNAYDSTGVINIYNSNNSTGTVYGLYSTGDFSTINSFLVNASTDDFSAGIIYITNIGNNDVYGIYNSTANTYVQRDGYASGLVYISNIGNGDVYGMCGEELNNLESYSVSSDNAIVNRSNIWLQNIGNGNVYGMYGESMTNAFAEFEKNSTNNPVYEDASIHIINDGSGNAYGMYGSGNFSGYTTNSNKSMGSIIIQNRGNGNAYGMYGCALENLAEIESSYYHHGGISLDNYASGNIFGMYGTYDVSNDNYTGGTSEIWLRNMSDGNAVGIYTEGNTSNSGTININNLGTGTAIGIFGDENSIITNSGTININRYTFSQSGTIYNPTGTAGDVFGIYAKSGSTVNNSGTINITSNGTMYGIYVESGSSVTNTGTITLNGVSCDGATCNGSSTYNNHIVLNGGTLYNSGLMMAPQMNLNSMGGNVVAGLGSQFVVDNELSGDLNISSELVQSGNKTTYIAENMIDAGDISSLNVRSASAMFDASVAENGHDVVMQMKDFDDLTDNKSLAAFLANNYANGKGQDLFSALKSMDNMSAFNGTLSGLTGLNTFTQFAHEDLSAMREISFSMNNKLFENSGRDSFDISDSMGHFSFSSSHNSGSGQYGISSDKISDNWKLGYGMAMANINTSNGDGFSRQNKMWLFYMPATYTNDGYELVIAPKAGFANSEYSRRGYNNVNYEGYIEKRIFGLMNDLRYPLSFGNWTFAPDMAFNAIVYTQSGHEEEREFGLVIPDDRTVSVETGLGLYTKYEKTFESGSRLKLNTGLMAYREFGDSYNLKLGIQGMDGTFNLYNNDYKYRGAASMGFDYLMGRFHLYGNAQYFMDNDNYMNFKGGVSYRF